MTLNEAKTAMRARIAAFTGLQPTQIGWPNKTYTPPASGLWVRVAFKGAPSIIAGLADKPITREIGTLFIQCFDRNNNGEAAVQKLADQLKDWLGYYMSGQLELLMPSSIEVGDDGNGFYQINVSIPFRVN